MARDVLPSKRTWTSKVYVHAQMRPEIVERLKHAAAERGYRLGEFLEMLLDNVLPKDK